jgi:hypothetical protein
MSSWIIEGRYDFSIAEAQWLSDLAGIESDLDAVIRLCKTFSTCTDRLVRNPNEDPLGWFEDLQMVGDLAFAAVVRFGRTLTSGVRDGLPTEWINSLPDELNQAHKYFKTLRDKYIAHSVNCLEDNQVFVMLTPQFSKDQTPSSITVDRGRLIALSIKDVTLLSQLATELKALVEAEIKIESERVLAIAKKMPVEQIKSRSIDSVPIPGKQETFKPRSKFK